MSEVWTVEQYKKYVAKKSKRRSKYNNRIMTVDGIKFHSVKESQRYSLNKLRIKAGDLIKFEMQVPFQLPGKIKYFLDFREYLQSGEIHYVDVKGVRTAVYRIKKKQVEEIYGIRITEV